MSAQSTCYQRRSNAVALTESIEAGQLKPAIDRTYPLRDTAEAMRHLGAGHVRGKVVISIADASANGTG